MHDGRPTPLRRSRRHTDNERREILNPTDDVPTNYCGVPVVGLFSGWRGSRPLRGPAGASVETVGAGTRAGVETAGCG
jgi:hypothetical protein